MTEANEEKTCPKCGNEMEVGFLLDHTYANLIPTIWIEGVPERSFWRFARIKGKRRHRVDSYRCIECGFLENYAAEQWMGWPDR